MNNNGEKMNNSKLISVVIEAKVNNDKLNKCLKSVINQTYKNIEILLISNNLDEFKDLEYLDERIILSTDYRNIATGEYILFLNQEDYLSVDYFRLMLENNDSDFSISNIVFNTDEVKRYNPLFKNTFNLDLNLEHNKKLFLEEFKMYLTLGNVLVKRELFLTSESILEAFNKSKTIKQSLNSIYYSDNSHNAINVASKDLLLFSNELEELKVKMVFGNYKYISFDIFDTLVLRPFYEPSDLFGLLDNKYFELTNSRTSFKKMRISSEFAKRTLILKTDKIKEDVSIDEIYEQIGLTYKINKSILEELKEYEKALEIEFCVPRNTTKEIFEMLLHINKEIILISDMYLDEKTILGILKKNGYENFKKLYLSSIHNKTKSSSELFSVVAKDLGCETSEILHIGDNYNADVISATKAGVEGVYYPKALDIFENRIDKIKTNGLSTFIISGLQDSEVLKVTKSLVANKYFDNPFVKYKDSTNFNMDIFNFGYYVLGTYLLGILEDFKQFESCKIGIIKDYNFLIYEGLKVVNEFNNKFQIIKLVDVNREDILQLLVGGESDLLNLPLDYYKYSNVSILKLLEFCSENNKENKVVESNFTSSFEFDEFINDFIENNFSEEKLFESQRRIIRKLEVYNDLDVIFDLSNKGQILNFFSTKTRNNPNVTSIEEVFIEKSNCLEIQIIQNGALEFVRNYYSAFYKYESQIQVDLCELKTPFNSFFNLNNSDIEMFNDVYVMECIYNNANKVSLKAITNKKLIKNIFTNIEDKRLLSNFLKDRKIVCFGSGKIFSNFINNFSELEIDFVLDNNSDKKGSVVNGYTIKNPCCIDNFKEIFIIITMAAYQQIEKQLIELGLEKNIDFISYKDI